MFDGRCFVRLESRASNMFEAGMRTTLAQRLVSIVSSVFDQTCFNRLATHLNISIFGHQTMFDGVWSPNIYRLSGPLRELQNKGKRRIYTTFIWGTALLNFSTRANNIGHRPLVFCRVKENFSPRVPKNLCGPRPPQEVVSARVKRGPRAANQNYSRPQSPFAQD